MASSKLLNQGRDRLSKADEEDPASPAGAAAAERPGRASSAAIVSPMIVPAPYAGTEGAQLNASEHDDLAACEAAVDGLRLAFWAAGKALQVIRDARLYRETHASFEEYVEDRWDMSRAQAYRLIAAWSLAERLSPIGDKRLNEPQIRELLPVARSHGQNAAVTRPTESRSPRRYCMALSASCQTTASILLRLLSRSARIWLALQPAPTGRPPTR